MDIIDKDIKLPSDLAESVSDILLRMGIPTHLKGYLI